MRRMTLVNLALCHNRALEWHLFLKASQKAVSKHISKIVKGIVFLLLCIDLLQNRVAIFSEVLALHTTG